MPSCHQCAERHPLLASGGERSEGSADCVSIVPAKHSRYLLPAKHSPYLLPAGLVAIKLVADTGEQSLSILIFAALPVTLLTLLSKSELGQVRRSFLPAPTGAGDAQLPSSSVTCIVNMQLTLEQELLIWSHLFSLTCIDSCCCLASSRKCRSS